MKRADLRALADQIVAKRIDGHHPAEFEPHLRKSEQFEVQTCGHRCRVWITAHRGETGFWVVLRVDDGTAKGFHRPEMRSVKLAAA